jgi:HTH-type transcriptional regulator/antitoxin HigA
LTPTYLLGSMRGMIDSAAILNEREARDAKATVVEIDRALSSEHVFDAIVVGLPPEVVGRYRHALASQKADLEAQLDAYEAAKGGDYSQLKRRAGDDPGVALIVARITRRYSQKELARRLGLKEQQIQRYEADRYRSISLSNYRRIAHVLGVRWEMKLSDGTMPPLGSGWEVSTDISVSAVKKVVKHAKENNWFEDNLAGLEGEESHNYLQRYISDHILNYGSPTLLRTGMNVSHRFDDILLLAWKARVTRVAEQIIHNKKVEYRGLSITWLRDLVNLSMYDDGPARARDLLTTQGIILVVEPPISGLNLDGAAFLVGNTPVIGMTLRRDTIDNFWFTLLHEVGHIILHYKIDLRSGFFDDVDNADVNEIEKEANDFASNLLIPNERWMRSPARIAKYSGVIEKFALDLGVHPAIVFGRLQKERKNYAMFANKIGRGLVRKSLVEGG